jgi:alanine racemase
VQNTSTLELSFKAIANNVRFIRRMINKQVLLSAVVKGNAYGHGIEFMVPAMEKCGINHFSVFSSKEALRVHEVCKQETRIMIMGQIHNEDLTWAIENRIEFYIFETDRLHAAIHYAREAGKKALIHLELETGMNRLGFEEETLPDLISQVKSDLQHLELMGLCTHFAGAESISNYLRIQQQISKFNRLTTLFADAGLSPAYRHSACSAAALNYPETQLDMVRIGILFYGFWPSQETFIYQFRENNRKTDPLKRVISWKTKVMAVKRVKKGEFISYGTSYLATKNMTIAVVPVGYSYGYARNLSNLGRVLIHGKRTSVVGIINMNLMLIDCTDIPQVKKNDEVVLIGQQKKLAVSVASFSELSQQLNYELLTRLPTFIPRILVE